MVVADIAAACAGIAPQKPAETRVGGQLCTIESAEIENERSEASTKELDQLDIYYGR